jgi:Flp pilus assembly protein TadG
MPRQRSRLRPGVASVELAVVFLFFILPLLFGVWEVGRLVQVQQLVSNAAREGARLAAQGSTINSDGTLTQIRVSSGTPNVHDWVYQYLVAAGLSGLSPSDVTVTFAYTPASGFPSGSTEPYQGVKNQPFTLGVTIPWDKVRWVNLGLVRPTTVNYTVSWQVMVDDAFTVNESLPTY